MSGTIIFLNGASSSGKTCLLRAIQDAFSEPYLEMGIDKFIWMLPERYLERPLWDDVLGLASQAGQMGRRLVAGMHHAIRAAALQGLNVVADHVLVEVAWAGECARLFGDLPAWMVGVRCPLEVNEQREKSRKNRTLGQARLQFEVVHAHVVYDLEVDTSLLSPAECAQQVKALVQSGAAPRALKYLQNRVPPR